MSDKTPVWAGRVRGFHVSRSQFGVTEVQWCVEDTAGGAEVERGDAVVVMTAEHEAEVRDELVDLRARVAAASAEHYVDPYTAGSRLERCVCEQEWPCATRVALDGG